MTEAFAAGDTKVAPIIAIAASLTGAGGFYGTPVVDGARLAAEEANAERGFPPITLTVEDDGGSDEAARVAAHKICDSKAVAVIGPVLTTTSLAAGPIYAECGLASITGTAHGDDVPKNATTFQTVFNAGEMGSSLAVYLKYVLYRHKAIVLFRDNGYGRPFAEGFARAAKVLDLEITQRGFATDAERDEAIKFAAYDLSSPPIVLGILNADALPIITALRREAIPSPILAPSSLAGDQFAAEFAAEPEEKERKGYFTDNVYAASPIIFDTANAETLAFAERFRNRYHHEPTWPTMQGYDAARLAIAAVRNGGAATDLTTARKGAIDYLVSLDGKEHALAGVTGPLWFNTERHRVQPVRVGLFRNGVFGSAPIQLVSVARRSPEELASGEVFIPLRGQFMRRQQVVYTGLFLNDARRLDLQRSTYVADFYLWMRFIPDPEHHMADPTDIEFPGLARSSFNRTAPSEQRLLPDGSEYRLWHITGEVQNEFDLRRFPFDRQTLRLSFFNARSDVSRIVYVLDRDSFAASGSQSLIGKADPTFPIVSTGALRELTQWQPLAASEWRENLVTTSPLGDRKSAETGGRELSGFLLGVTLERRSLATALKTLLPLFLMTILMFASLNFPHNLVKEKVTVAITAALSGAVLLAAVNNQFGNIGYTFDAEYAFYVFFGLSLLCIVSVLVAERARTTGAHAVAYRVEGITKLIYLVAVAVVIAGAGYLASV